MGKEKESVKYESVSHNDIVLKLADENYLQYIFATYLSCFGNTRIGLTPYSQPEIISGVDENGKWKVKEEYQEEYDIIKQRFFDDDFTEIEYCFEFPIIKGTNEFQSTKGFIDMIVHIKPIRSEHFSCYAYTPEYRSGMEFLIEIKKEKDFENFGNILRQIKEYRALYSSQNGIKKWRSNIQTEGNPSGFCIIADKIPENLIRIFKNEGIIVISLEKVDKKLEMKK